MYRFGVNICQHKSIHIRYATDKGNIQYFKQFIISPKTEYRCPVLIITLRISR